MSRKSITLTLLVVVLLLPSVAPAIAAPELTVKTGLKYYTPGSQVKINGTAPAGAEVNIQIHITTTIIYTKNVTANGSGKFTDSYSLPDNATAAKYRVKAATEEEEENTYFYVLLISTQEMAETLINLAAKAEDLAKKTIDKLEEKGFTLLPGAKENYEIGLTSLNESESKLEDDDPVGAIDAAKESLIYFRNAMTLAWKSTKIEDIEDKISEALDNRLDRLNQTVIRAKEAVENQEIDDENKTKVMEKLDEAQDHIQNAADLLSERNIEEAAKELKEAYKLLKEAIALIRQILPKIKWSMILGFNQSIQSRLNDCEKALTQIKPKLDQNKLAKTQNKLGLVLGALNRANQRIRAHAAEHAMKELQNATDTLNEGIEEIKNGYGKVLGEINRMKARAWSMKGTEAIIRRWGLNPATVQEKIGELEQKIDDATDLVTEGKVEDAFKLLGKGWEWFPHFARAHMPWSFNRNSIGR